MHQNHYHKLVEGYLQKTLNKDELEVFFNLLATGELDPYLEEDMELTIKSALDDKRTKSGKFTLLKYAAAILVFALAVVLYRYSMSTAKNLIVPGREHAVLTMADGTRMTLDTILGARQQADNGVLLTKGANGALVYDLSQIKGANIDKLTTQVSTIETPKGGMYQLVLSDGSKVWLNASSKLKFPLMFEKDKRLVEVEGEVYFEVAHKEGQPFVVKSGRQEIKVLGTVFNVNAYATENIIKTTLLEGSIAVSTATATKILKPSQEALTTQQGIMVEDIDTEQAVAWKNGYFKFDKLTVKEMMPQIERWYNLEVVYSPQFKEERFVAKIKRTASVEELIEIFNAGGLEAKLEGRKLIISNVK